MLHDNTSPDSNNFQTEDSSHMGCHAISALQYFMFQRNVAPSSSGSLSPSNPVYLTLHMKVLQLFLMPGATTPVTHRNILQDLNLLQWHSENLASCNFDIHSAAFAVINFCFAPQCNFSLPCLSVTIYCILHPKYSHTRSSKYVFISSKLLSHLSTCSKHLAVFRAAISARNTTNT